MANIALGSSSEALQPDCIKALVVEFICTFLFVFAGVGSAMATAADDKMSGKNDEVVGLLFVAIAHALVVAVMISAGLKISGGHLNPAVTLGLCVGGHITVVRSILYWIDQCLASVAACALLKYLTGGVMTPVHTLAAGIDSVQGVTMEIVLTFSLLFTVYATIVDNTTAKEEGSRSFQGPILTGLVVGANIMAGGSFSGASMNPARSFGPALITGIWTDHWVYWVGPLIGGGLAGIIYDNCFFRSSNNYVVVLPRDEEEENNNNL